MFSRASSINGHTSKFTFHAAMIRDTLPELHGAAGVEIVKKVRHLKPYEVVVPLDSSKLASSLDIPSLGDVGRKVNEIVSHAYLTLSCNSFSI